MPDDYFDSLNNNEKDEVLGSTICDLVSGLGVYATSPDVLYRIIDHHDAQHEITIRILQQYAITLLLAKRDSIHNKFLKNIGQAKETVSITLVENMRKVIRRLVKEKAELVSYIQKLEKKTRHNNDDAMHFKKIEARLRDKIEALQDEVEELRHASHHKKKNTPRSESPIEKPDNVNHHDHNDHPKKKVVIDKDKFKEARQKMIEQRGLQDASDDASDHEENDDDWSTGDGSEDTSGDGSGLDEESEAIAEHLRKSD
jgi:hypothetical protein